MSYAGSNVFANALYAVGGVLSNALFTPSVMRAFHGAFQYMEALTGQIGWYRGEYDPEAFDIKEVVFGGKKRNPKKRKLL